MEDLESTSQEVGELPLAQSGPLLESLMCIEVWGAGRFAAEGVTRIASVMTSEGLGHALTVELSLVS